MLNYTHEDGFARVALRGDLTPGLHRSLCETLELLTGAYCHDRVEFVIDSPGGSVDTLFDCADTIAH